MIKPVLSLLSVAKDATAITLQDTTGAYNASTNTGGYGAPNPVAPVKAGLKIRYWADDLPYVNKIISGTPLTELLAAGHAFTYPELGLPEGKFTSGVHHIQYYPLETTTCVISLTQNSRQIVVTSGTLPSAWDAAYKAVVLLDAASNVVSGILMIDHSLPLASDFWVDKEWSTASVTGYKLLLATEADLKILITTLAEACVTRRIAALPAKQHCDRGEVEHLSDLITWKFAADVKFQGKDYSGAHNAIVAVEKSCSGPECTATPCKTCA